jgi:hypothetical protein
MVVTFRRRSRRVLPDSAWVRHRHLQYGISSPVAVLAAASQRTSRIELGTAVTPLGSARWAGEHGMNFLTSSVVKAEESEDFAEIQLSHLRTFRAHHPDTRLASRPLTPPPARTTPND